MLLGKRARVWKSGWGRCEIVIFLAVFLLCACTKNESKVEPLVLDVKDVEKNKEAAGSFDKGYDLSVDEEERLEAERDCGAVMKLISDIYARADKGEALNVVLPVETVLQMKKRVGESGWSVTTATPYASMENWKGVEQFLKDCRKGKGGAVTIYDIHSDGALTRMKYSFDGTDMYVLTAITCWTEEGQPEMADITYTRIKEWTYSEKGWFCYEVCVPEPPEVTEIVDGSCLVRIRPRNKKQRELSEKCVYGIGYQGNNLLCSNWDASHMQALDYNGLYEYLYAMKYGKKFNGEDYADGIPRDSFEKLIMEYLPVTAEQIRKYAVFNTKKQTYAWVRLGCFNYTPTFFSTSTPEVVQIRKNKDGTVTLTVEAVCDMVLCDEAVIIHKITVRFAEDGSFQYLGNKILHGGIKKIPDYEYRIRKAQR